MAVQARFYVAETTHYPAYNGGSSSGWAAPAPWGKVILRPVTRGEANKEWASATPSGNIDLTIHGNALKWFTERLGQELAIIFDDRPDNE